MKPTALDSFHPLVSVVFFATVLVFCMAAFQPVYLAISCVASFAYGVFLRGWRAVAHTLVWQVPLVMIIAAVNPLFSASGSTELFRVGVRVVYAESLFYGACMGVMLMAMMQWFANASCVLTSDKVMAVLGNKAPTIALMVSMINRLVPQFVTRGREIEAVQGACMPSVVSPTVRAKTRQRLRLISVMMGWSMEDSLETADSMRARGWGACRQRSAYCRDRFRTGDGVVLGVLVALAALNAFLAFVACVQFQFYPTLSILTFWWGYVPYTALVATPILLQVGEMIRWMH
ncbi:MAG: energy-coupling factor transporter transmembrane component T [Raoultibacter sp.]